MGAKGSSLSTILGPETYQPYNDLGGAGDTPYFARPDYTLSPGLDSRENYALNEALKRNPLAGTDYTDPLMYRGAIGLQNRLASEAQAGMGGVSDQPMLRAIAALRKSGRGSMLMGDQLATLGADARTGLALYNAKTRPAYASLLSQMGAMGTGTAAAYQSADAARRGLGQAFDEARRQAIKKAIEDTGIFGKLVSPFAGNTFNTGVNQFYGRAPQVTAQNKQTLSEVQSWNPAAKSALGGLNV